MMPQDTHTHTHSHTGSSASSPDTVGRPLIPQHIYNLCNDNLIPPAGHGEHTLPFCSSRSLPKPEHGRVSSNSCFSALSLPLSPGLRSADCSSHSPRPGAGSDPGADLLKKQQPCCVLASWPVSDRPSATCSNTVLMAVTVSMNRGVVLKTSVACQGY